MGRSWSTETLFFDGDSYYDAAIASIEAATRSIDMETYIYDADSTGRRFEDALGRAVQRGVTVRLMVDGIGASTWTDRRARELEKLGAHVRIYHPVKFSSLMRRLMIDVGIRRHTAKQGSALLSRLNRRNHRKMIVIDGREAWVGSLNISDVHSAKVIGPLAWRDTGARVEGKAILDLIAGFEFAWVRSHTLDGHRRWTEALLPFRRREHTRSPLVRMNFTLRLRRKNFREFSVRLRDAEARIWVTNAYLAPSHPILRRLKAAAERGVDVRVLVPRRSDVFFMPWVAGSYYAELLHSGVRIYEYLPRFLHAKSVIIDHWAVVGTSNLNRRSLMKDFEVDIVLRKNESLSSLEEQFLRDLKESEEVRAARGGVRALLGRMIIVFMKEWI